MIWKRKQPKEWSPDHVLAHMLAMNVESWAALQANGVTEDTELRLDFFYEAPDAASAQQLAEYLSAETDYDVSPEDDAVTGTTQPTTITKEMLDQWVAWMVGAGHEHGRCEFDGWGAEIP
jgi:hypothetical protein